MRREIFLLVAVMGCGNAAKSATDASATVLPAATGHAASSTPAPSAAPSGALAAAPGSAPAPSDVRKPFDAPVVSKCDGVALTLGNARFDQGHLEVDATLTNKGKTSYALIATMDGSTDARRNPAIRFTLAPNEQKPVGYCGMMNAMTDADFMTLAPGASKKLEWIYVPQPAHSGAFTLRATYTNNPDRALERMGVSNKDDESRFALKIQKTVACQVTSAPLTINVP